MHPLPCGIFKESYQDQSHWRVLSGGLETDWASLQLQQQSVILGLSYKGPASWWDTLKTSKKCYLMFELEISLCLSQVSIPITPSNCIVDSILPFLSLAYGKSSLLPLTAYVSFCQYQHPIVAHPLSP